MEGARQLDAGGYLWTFAAMFGIFAVALSGMLFFLRPPLTLQIAFMGGITGFLWVAFVYMLIAIYRTGREPAQADGPARFACKHCGRGFTEQKLWTLHQKSCVEMRI